MTKPPSPIPLSMKVAAFVAFYMGFGALSMLIKIEVAGTSVHGLFGLTGYTAGGYYVLLWLICWYAAAGIWRLREPARRIALFLACYLLLESLVSGFLRPVTHTPLLVGLLEALRGGGPITGPLLRSPVGESLVTPRIVAATETILYIVGAWFLITRKAAFGKPPTPPLQ